MPDDKTLEYFFDFSSPWTYLADTHVDAFAARHGARVLRRPMLLGGVFKGIGGPVVPIQTFGDAKRQYALTELHRWAAWRDVPLAWPSRFPMRTLLPLRVACQLDLSQASAIDWCARIFKAYWADDEDISLPEVVAEHLSAAGLDAPALLEGTQDPAVKRRLIDATDEAVRRGVFGAPTFFVGEDLFWGQDRFDHIAAALNDAP